MLFFRSLLCQIIFYLNFLMFGLFCPIALLLPQRWSWAYAVTWMRMTIFLWRITTNSTLEVRGKENIPEGGFILASKHQSTWETLGFAPIVYHIVFIMKKELMYLPVFGWFTWRTGMIPINRSDRGKVIGPMVEASRKAIEAGRQIVIFMEGTRMAAGAARPYKVGTARLYSAINCPVVPVALNTGLFWPRNSFWRYSGKVIIEFLPPIEPGKDPSEMMEELERDVEARSNALILETAMSPNPPPTIDDALDRLAKRGVDISSVRPNAS